jgi:hypothetical protein
MLTSKRERNNGNGNDVGNCQKSGKPFSCIGNVFAIDSSLSIGDSSLSMGDPLKGKFEN